MLEVLGDSAKWDALSETDQYSIARDVAARIEPDIKLVAITEHSLGGQRHRTAQYRHGDAYLRLIPGAKAELGYDLANLNQLSPEAQESWECTKGRLNLSLAEYLAKMMTPVRTVQLMPFLIEDKAFSPAEKVPIAKPPLPDFLLKQYPPDKQWYAIQEVTLESAREAASKSGFRLPSSDEWEYACSAGSRTIFRWGVDCPLDCYPTEAPRGPEGLEKYAKNFFKRVPPTEERLERMRESYRWNRFDLHVRPNAFGLMIANDPYLWEICEDGVVRGGDGGVNVCGGVGFLAGWLPLASSFCPLRIEEKQTLEKPYIRRTLTISAT